MSEYYHKGNANICFDCKKACGGCPWSEIDPETDHQRFAPVPGWTATETVVNLGGRHSRKEKTYHITACPLFEKDDERKGGNNCELDLNELRWLLSRWRREDV